MNRLLCLTACLFLSSFPALAQTGLPAGSSDKPLEITASQTLEWHRNDNQYVAHGDVLAKQGDVSIQSDVMTADYRPDAKGGGTNIYKLTADGNVRVVSQGSTAVGDKAVYDVEKAVAVMTGNDLRLTSPEQTVTARDRFEYWVNEGRLNAIGQAHVVRGEDLIDADTMAAIFSDDPQTHARTLSKLEAQGHVVITTPTERLQGDRGTYDAATTVATLTGHVIIQRGPNVLQGDSADINLTTNISRMHGGGPSGQRVRGVFYPGSEKKTP